VGIRKVVYHGPATLLSAVNPNTLNGVLSGTALNTIVVVGAPLVLEVADTTVCPLVKPLPIIAMSLTIYCVLSLVYTVILVVKLL
jgi:hypothetical protein